MPQRRCTAGEKSAPEMPETEPRQAGLAEWASFIYTSLLFTEIF